MTRRIFPFLAFLLFASLSAFAQGSPYVVGARIDWLGQKLVVDISLDLGKAALRMPQARSEAERMVTRDLSSLIKDAVFAILVDSWRDVGATTDDGTLGIDELLGLLGGGTRTSARFSGDFTKYLTSYEFALTRLSALYVRHSIPYDVPPSLRFVPTKPYTGIVIYAAGLYPVQGEFIKAALAPCLFPRIYDENMSLVLERNMMSPDAVRRWGTVAYAKELAGSSLEARVGDDPIRIMAYRVFGTNRTDIVITEEDSLKILNLPENRALLREGRIVVILDAPEPGSGGN
ncbi:MAG: hypothetical protein NT080_04150 [Spirochaetes bacterium]|nr:hypothetical protein [Spirochaetota bacterium]